jgi:uncharacterized membrane protein YagU involved in acid resistance
MNVNIRRAIGAGIAGTAVITMVGLFVAPMMGIPKMDIAAMLASQMGGMNAPGWMAHFMIGTILAIGYAVVAPALPGPAPLRGAVYAIAPWFLAQIVVMPMMGMGLFSGSMVMAGGSLIGHLAYGAVVGAIYGAPQSAALRVHA